MLVCHYYNYIVRCSVFLCFSRKNTPSVRMGMPGLRSRTALRSSFATQHEKLLRRSRQLRLRNINPSPFAAKTMRMQHTKTKSPYGSRWVLSPSLCHKWGGVNYRLQATRQFRSPRCGGGSSNIPLLGGGSSFCPPRYSK
jgi:hypothetical protein